VVSLFFGSPMEAYLLYISFWANFLAYKSSSLQCKAHDFDSQNKIVPMDPQVNIFNHFILHFALLYSFIIFVKSNLHIIIW